MMSERWYRAFGQPQYGEEASPPSTGQLIAMVDPHGGESMVRTERPSISVRGVRRFSFTLAPKSPFSPPTRQGVLDSLTAYLSGQSMDTGNIEAQASPYNKVLSVLPRPNGTVHVGLQIGPTLSVLTPDGFVKAGNLVADHTEHGGRNWLNVKSMLERRVGQVKDVSSRVALLRPSEVLPEDLPAGLQEVPDTAAGLFTPLVVGGAVGGTMLLVGGAVVGTLLLSRWLFRE